MTIHPTASWLDLQPPPNVEVNMHPILRAGLTILCAAVLAWPLLFWGKPAFPHRQDANVGTKQPMIQYVMPPRDLLW